MTAFTRFSLAMAVVAGIVAATAPLPLSAQRASGDRPVPFAPGETLHYDVSWADLLTAGSATLTVRDRRTSYGGAPAWYIVAEGQPTPLLSKLYALYYKADTLLDTRTLLPQRGSIYSRERRRERMKEILFDQPRRSATYRLTGDRGAEEVHRLNGPTHDALSALVALRSIRLAVGASTAFAVADSGELYRVSARVEGRETVQSTGQPVPAWKVLLSVLDAKGQRFGQDVALWLSDDEQRVPLRLQATLPVGSFVLTRASR